MITIDPYEAALRVAHTPIKLRCNVQIELAWLKSNCTERAGLAVRRPIARVCNTSSIVARSFDS